MSVHQGLGHETNHVISEFAIFVQQIIGTETNTMTLA